MNYFSLDAIGAILLVVLAIVSIPSLIHSIIYFKDSQHVAKRGEQAIYYSAMALLIAAVGFGYIANHIVMTWVITEITTIASGVLIYHHRTQHALEGVWKYVFVCAISITLVFIGILFWSLALMEIGVDDLSYASLMQNASQMSSTWLTLGFIFIFTGYTVKMGLFPMFTAGIDAKDNAPSPAAAMLSSVLVNLGFIGIYRSYAVVCASPLASWGKVLLISTALLTLFISTIYVVRIRNIKRMLAYSSIEHSAIVALGLSFGPAGTFAAILHLVMHSLIKSGLFIHFTQLWRVYRSKNTSFMGDYFKLNPFGAFVFMLGMLSITAIPPSGLFISELKLFLAMLSQGYWPVMVVVVLFLTVLIWALIKNTMSIVFLPSSQPRTFDAPKISPWESMTQLILFLLAIWIGFFTPEALVKLIETAASIII